MTGLLDDRALLQAAERVRADAELVGVDLVDAFLPQKTAPRTGGPVLVAAPIESWTPERCST